jgi:hypothetical protein
MLGKNDNTSKVHERETFVGSDFDFCTLDFCTLFGFNCLFRAYRV